MVDRKRAQTGGSSVAPSALPHGGRAQSDADPLVLRVLTMNIWNFDGPYEARQRMLREGIEKLQPDLMAFQEAGYDGHRDQVRDLLRGLDRVAHQFDGLKSLPFNNGCCIASRWPFELMETLSLQVTERAKKYPYAAMAARVAVPGTPRPLLFVCAKPSWELNREYERELQAVELAKMVQRLARREDLPTVIAGDFDAAPDRASIRFLTGRQSLAGLSVQYIDAWEHAGDGSSGATWSYENKMALGEMERIGCGQQSRRIDYVFVGSWHDYAGAPEVRSCRVVLNKPQSGVWPSDHYALLAEIAVRP